MRIYMQKDENRAGKMVEILIHRTYYFECPSGQKKKINMLCRYQYNIFITHTSATGLYSYQG